MKCYQVAKGTKGLVVGPHNGPDGEIEARDWVTRQDLTFTETLIDPIRLFNNPGDYDFSTRAVQLAQRGYILFGGPGGDDWNAMWVLAVLYDDVKVS